MAGVAGDAAAMAPVQGGLRIPQLEVAVSTDPGREPAKQVNEDSARARMTRHGYLSVVCDGMGGHVGGKEASTLAIETIFRVMDATPEGRPPELLAAAIREANLAVHTKGTNEPSLKGMGSTCVAILTHEGGTEIAHVGDSRCYLVTQGQVYQVTKDHSLVQRLVDANMLTPDEAANHPSANQITNALGMKADVEVEVRPTPFPHHPGDIFILCSDGLSDEIGPQDLAQILAPYPPIELATQQMVDLANARGGHDNITVIAVRFPGGGPFTPLIASSRTATPIAVAATTTMEMVADSGGHLVQAHAGSPSGPMPQAPIAGQQPQQAPIPAFQPPPAYEVPAASIRSRRGGGGILLAIILLLLLGGGGVAAYLYLRKPPVEAPNTPPSDEEEPTTTSTKSPKVKPSLGTIPAKSVDTDEPPPTTASSPTKKPPIGPPATTLAPPTTDTTLTTTTPPDPTVKNPSGGATTDSTTKNQGGPSSGHANP